MKFASHLVEELLQRSSNQFNSLNEYPCLITLIKALTARNAFGGTSHRYLPQDQGHRLSSCCFRFRNEYLL